MSESKSESTSESSKGKFKSKIKSSLKSVATLKNAVIAIMILACIYIIVLFFWDIYELDLDKSQDQKLKNQILLPVLAVLAGASAMTVFYVQ